MNKKEIIDIIYDMEIETSDSKSSIISAYFKFAENTKKIDPKEMENARVVKTKLAIPIQNGKPRIKIYRSFLPPDVIKLLEHTTKNGMDVGTTLREYREISDLAKKLETSIVNKLKVPLIMSFLVTLMMWNLLDGFTDMFNDPTIKVSDLAKFIHSYYLYIVIPILSALAILFLFFPKHIFGIKKIYKKIESLLVVNTIRALFENGSTSVDIIPFLKHTFKMNKIRTNQDTIFDLAKILYTYKHININEATKLSDLEYLKLKDFFSRITEKRKEEVINMSEVVDELIKNLSTFLLLIPFGIAGYAIGKALTALFSEINL